MKAKRLSLDCQLLALLLDHGPQYQKALVIDSGRDKKCVGLRLRQLESVGMVECQPVGTALIWSIGERVRLGAMLPKREEE